MKIRLSSFIVLLSSFMLLCQPAFAGGMSSLHSLDSGSVTITNTQKRSSWVPVALLFRFDAPASGTITVERRTGSITFQLTTVDLSDNLYAVWIPEAPITFSLNDVLSISTPAAAGYVEIIRKGD